MKTNRRRFLVALACIPGLRWLKPPPQELWGFPILTEGLMVGFDRQWEYQERILRALRKGQRLTLNVPRRHGKAYMTRAYIEALEKIR